jgi:hypothetical protein
MVAVNGRDSGFGFRLPNSVEIVGACVVVRRNEYRGLLSKYGRKKTLRRLRRR